MAGGWRHYSVLSWPCNAGDEVMFTIICVTSRSSHRHNVINDCAYTGTRTYQVRYTWYTRYTPGNPYSYLPVLRSSQFLNQEAYFIATSYSVEHAYQGRGNTLLRSFTPSCGTLRPATLSPVLVMEDSRLERTLRIGRQALPADAKLCLLIPTTRVLPSAALRFS